MVCRMVSHSTFRRKLLGHPVPRLQEDTSTTKPKIAMERMIPRPFFFNMIEVFVIQIGNDAVPQNISNKDIVFRFNLPNLEKYFRKQLLRPPVCTFAATIQTI